MAAKAKLVICLACLALLGMTGCAPESQSAVRLNVTLAAKSPEGIEILVCPRDAAGNIVPLEGSLDVALWSLSHENCCARESGRHYGEAPTQQWLDVALEAGSYEPGLGARIWLPYRAFLPGALEFCELEFLLTRPGETIEGGESGWDIGVAPPP